MRKILVVDDEPHIRSIIRKFGEFEGYEVYEAVNGIDAIKQCKMMNFDIIIMDVMMPDLDGFSTVKEIRKQLDVPIIMLSARGEEYDRIYGFEAGIDDYVVKPFSPKELMMRIKAILKRRESNQVKKQNDIFEFERFKIDYTSRKVFIDDQEIYLSPKEYMLLFYMSKREGIALTREQLLEDIWGYGYDSDDRTLDTHIKLLRKKMGEYAKLIVTLRGMGYRFEKKK